jgi:Tol biopolymer transport system component
MRTNNDNIKIRRSRVLPTRTRFGGLAVSAMLILSILLLAFQINQSAWAGTFPGPNGQIAFSSNRDTHPEDEENDKDEVYVMNADGSGETRLTNNDADDVEPSWSPDGEKIAFTSYRDGDAEIYVMNADGSDVTRLTDNDDADDIHPTWSPDGEKIAFSSDRDDEETGRNDIFVMDATDGSDVTRLTDNDDADDIHPTWSPDGEKIAFSSDRDDNEGVYDIFVMDATDGSDVARLTDNDTTDQHPTWSPDGEKIAFTSYRDGNAEIYVMNANDGSGETRLTNNDITDDIQPTWSPDGEKIAFNRIFSPEDEEVDDGQIFVMDATDGSDVARLTDNDDDDAEPDWGTNTSSPDGKDNKDKKHNHKDNKHDQ